MQLNNILISTLMITFSSLSFAADPQGLLTAATAPDSLAILPPPPTENSVAFQADKAAYETGRVLRDKARTQLATKDAHYKKFGHAFSEAFGLPLTASHTPKIYHLLSVVLKDSHDFAMRGAKNHYQRVRPFVIYKDSTCTPNKDAKMATTGSYPSGHASFGWAAALVLSEINPERQTQLLRRGYDFGQSRVICGAHWQSDVDNGRLMGAAVVSTLHSNPNFAHALSAAKAEFSNLIPRQAH
jgi:acid phosphatase (class A)